MPRLLLSHSDDPELLNLTAPVFERYAHMHGYACRLISGEVDTSGRSAHWSKIRLLQAQLPDFDLVLWCDADILLRGRSDVAAGLQPGDIQGLVMEQTPHGIGPNTGLWVLRNTALDFVNNVWRTGQLPDASLHDQATVAHLLGFSYLPDYTRPVASSPWLAETSWLDSRWNVLRAVHPERVQSAYGIHYGGMGSERVALMRQQIIDDRLSGWERLLPQDIVSDMTRWISGETP